MIKNIYWSLMKSTRYWRPVLMKLEFLLKIFEKIQISNFMKICLMEAEFFHADNRTDGREGGQTDRQT
jgi:hypothetical protein